jgi:dihydropteroate synthase
MRWSCRGRTFDLEARPLVMGVVNVTPDSFSDGGRFLDASLAVAHARRLLEDGADLLDLGAESTRPGAEPVPADEQWRRLGPVITELAAEGGACLSVDTASADVAERALEAGVQVVNDVTAFGDPRMAGVVAAAGAGVVLMHMQGNPRTMQQAPRYGDVAAEVRAWLAERVASAVNAGIAADTIAVDPGIGFGKALEHNLQLIARLDEIAALGRPVLLGASRKSFLGRLLAAEVDERLEGSLAAAAVGVYAGADIVRTHDVSATVRAVVVAAALRAARRVTVA